MVLKMPDLYENTPFLTKKIVYISEKADNFWRHLIFFTLMLY